ncbi:DUF4192 domain-containing protein [Actinoplanes sp. HUAS TT8]|uniref:DUF4192 domain-containing protein n=1 Tax=Actinoplanes sp. HUAS TT8 TaxID=3447453 RepID=UPI003F520E61
MNLEIKSPSDAATIIPYLLGYQPQHALTALALDHGTIICTAAQVLPEDPADIRDAIGHLVTALTANDVTNVLLVGYGTHPVRDAVEQGIEAFAAAGVNVVDAMRVGDDRIWHVGCGDPDCETEGMPYDPQSSVVAATATFVGLQVAPDRDALHARLAPITGAERTAMRAAIETAVHTFSRPKGLADAATLVRQLLADAVESRLPDDRAAQLLVLLGFKRLQDAVFKLVHGTDAQIQAWTDLTRRAGTGMLACAPAMLLAMAALQAGDGVTAAVAAARACAADPDDELAGVLEQAIHLGLNPQRLIQFLHG